MITDVMQIKCPAARAFDLMADPRNEIRWNSGVSEVELKSGEPIGEGSRFGVVDKRGKHEVLITAYKRPGELSFALHDARMDVDIDYELSEANGTTTMTGRFNAKAKGLMRSCAAARSADPAGYRKGARPFRPPLRNGRLTRIQSPAHYGICCQDR